MRRAKRNRAFTLVELLIVIIIVGILAAVAIPQFGSSSNDAKLAALDADLAAVRNAIELYFHQHSGAYPGVVKQHDGVAHTTTADAFVKQLTMYSNAGGNTSATKDTTTYPYGPYLRRGFPTNPLAASGVSDATSVLVGTEATAITGEASPTAAWRVSSATGQFVANNTDYDDR